MSVYWVPQIVDWSRCVRREGEFDKYCHNSYIHLKQNNNSSLLLIKCKIAFKYMI